MAPSTGVLLVALVLLQATSSIQGEDIVSNIDNLVDNIITGLKTYLPEQGLTNISIPHIEANITLPDVPLLGDVTTGLIVDNAVVTNFYDVARFNEETVTYHTDTKTLTVQFGLIFDDLEVAFIMTLDRIIKVEEKHAKASVKKGMGSVTLSVNLETLKLKAEDVHINKVGDVSLSVKGVSIWVSGALAVIPPLVKSTLVNVVNSKGVSLLQRALDKFDLNKFLKPPATSTAWL